MRRLVRGPDAFASTPKGLFRRLGFHAPGSAWEPIIGAEGMRPGGEFPEERRDAEHVAYPLLYVSAVASGQALFASMDRGTSWRRVGERDLHLALLASDGSLYALDGIRLHRSRDFGATFELMPDAMFPRAAYPIAWREAAGAIWIHCEDKLDGFRAWFRFSGSRLEIEDPPDEEPEASFDALWASLPR